MSQLSKKVESALIRADYARVFIKGGLLAYRRIGAGAGAEVTVWAVDGGLVAVVARAPGKLPAGDFHTAGKLEAWDDAALTAWFEALLTPAT